MPIMYVNPAGAKRARLPKRPTGAALARARREHAARVRRIEHAYDPPTGRRPSRPKKNPAGKPRKKRVVTPAFTGGQPSHSHHRRYLDRLKKRKPRGKRRKLYGAAAKAHAKKSAARRRKRRVTPKRRARAMPKSRRRRRKAASAPKRRRRRSRAAAPKRRRRRKASAPKRRRRRKAAAPKRRRRRKASAPKRRRRRKASAPKRRRRRRKASAPKRRRRRKASAPKRRKRRRRARRTVKDHGVPSHAVRGGHTMKLYGNPSRRRRRRRRGSTARRYRRNGARRRYHRNPLGGTFGALLDIVKTAAPAVGSLLVSRIASGFLAPKVPMIDKLGPAAKPVVSAAVLFGMTYVSKMGPLAKYRRELLIGSGINLLLDVASAFLPANVKSMLQLGDNGIYDRALSDYVQVGDYLTTGATPIDDNITLSDYITTGAVEEELGQLGDGLEQELGLEEELGIDEGVSQSAFLAPVQQRSFLSPVPARSFTQQVPRAGAGLDNPGLLYTGIFGGGFGS
jgi:hypothetical protein